MNTDIALIMSEAFSQLPREEVILIKYSLQNNVGAFGSTANKEATEDSRETYECVTTLGKYKSATNKGNTGDIPSFSRYFVFIGKVELSKEYNKILHEDIIYDIRTFGYDVHSNVTEVFAVSDVNNEDDSL